MEVSGQLYEPTALPPEMEQPVPIFRRQGGPQSRSGSGSEEKKSQPLPGLEHQTSNPQPVWIYVAQKDKVQW